MKYGCYLASMLVSSAFPNELISPCVTKLVPDGLFFLLKENMTDSSAFPNEMLIFCGTNLFSDQLFFLLEVQSYSVQLSTTDL